MGKKRFQVVIYALILAIIIAVAAIVILVFERKNNEELTARLNEKSTEISNNSKNVFVATKDIIRGENLIQGVNVDIQPIYSGQPDGIYMTSEQVGQAARIDIAAGSPVYKNSVAEEEITADTRKYEISVVNLTSRQADKDIVDVRILFPDGTDYTVLSKKTIRDLSGSMFNMFLNEDEILRLDSATVDAATLGGRLYTTEYVEPTLQDEAVPFYPVKQTTLDLINSDPNILDIAQETLNSQVRQSLEERMMSLKASIGDGETLSADFKSQVSVDQPSASDGGSIDDVAPVSETQAAATDASATTN